MNPPDGEAVEQLMEQISVAPALQLLLIAVVGVLYCFVGYRLFKVVLAVSGFVLAGGLAATVATVGFPDAPAVWVVVGLIAGLVGAAALILLY